MPVRIRERLASAIDNQYSNHPEAAAMRDQMDDAGVSGTTLGEDHTGHAIINGIQESRRAQGESGAGESEAFRRVAMEASELVVKSVAGDISAIEAQSHGEIAVSAPESAPEHR